MIKNLFHGMKVQTITFCASSLSGIVLIVCMMAIGKIHMDVKSFWNELDGEMDEFKVGRNGTLLFSNFTTR